MVIKAMKNFFETIEKYKRMYAKTEEIEEIFDQFKKVIEEMNQKENWSILRYIGESDDRLTSLKHGHIYYWPCSKANPLYRGVIDEEEYTAYWYSTEPEDWEILEDPTGMVFQTLYEGGKEHVSRSEYQFVMQQVKTLFEK